MKNYPGYLPQSHRILWLLIRVALMLWGIYGIFHGSVVEFLEAIFAILFTHLWDYFQVFGGRSFIIRIGYENQTMLNVLMFVCVVIGSTLNNRTDFGSFDIVTHTCSGFISAWFGYDLRCLCRRKIIQSFLRLSRRCSAFASHSALTSAGRYTNLPWTISTGFRFSALRRQRITAL